jgi:hypothetical protein
MLLRYEETHIITWPHKNILNIDVGLPELP